MLEGKWGKEEVERNKGLGSEHEGRQSYGRVKEWKGQRTEEDQM